MSKYTEWTDQDLVVEVVRRMPQDKYRYHRGGAQKFHSIVWEAWQPDTDPLALEDVRREIRSWGWGHKARWIPQIGKYEAEAIRIPGILNRQGSFKAKDADRGRAWLIAFLMATDEEKGK